MKRTTVVPLTALVPGQRAKLVRVEAGHQATHRMSELGLTHGVELEVLHRNSHGPLLISVRDTRLAVGRGMANKVMVELIADVSCVSSPPL
jgi:Fe2+ transport system protein FeoA